MEFEKNIIVITGHTASGKSAIGLELLDKINSSVILNIDSMQIYKNNKILSAQPVQRADHKLYGFLDDNSRFSVYQLLSLIKDELKLGNYKNFIILGGSPLYIRLLFDGINNEQTGDLFLRESANKIYDQDRNKMYQKVLERFPELSSKISVNDKMRVVRAFLKIDHSSTEKKNFIPNDYKVHKFLLYKSRDILYKNAEIRFKNMVENGGIDEVKNFIEIYKDHNYKNFQSFKTIGFCEIEDYLNNKIKIEDVLEIGSKKSRHYIKHQDTWYKNKFLDFEKIQTFPEISEKLKL